MSAEYKPSRFRILNEDVRRALKNLPIGVSVAFQALHGGYDVDIDPLHNRFFVEDRKKAELDLLEKSKKLYSETVAWHGCLLSEEEVKKAKEKFDKLCIDLEKAKKEYNLKQSTFKELEQECAELRATLAMR